MIRIAEDIWIDPKSVSVVDIGVLGGLSIVLLNGATIHVTSTYVPYLCGALEVDSENIMKLMAERSMSVSEEK